MSEAERSMLERMLREGPERRMAQDAAHGKPPQRADLWQAARYRSRLEALDRAPGGVVLEELAPAGGLGLDRIEGRD